MASAAPPPTTMTAATPAMIHIQGGPEESLAVASIAVLLASPVHVTLLPLIVPSALACATLVGKFTVIVVSSRSA